MARFSLHRLPKGQRVQLIGEFYDVIAALKSREEVRAFCRDLLNPDEITMLMRRVEIAALLWAKFTYEEVQKLTGAGVSTIAAVAKKLNQEERDGYEIVIKRLLDQRKKRIQAYKRNRKRQESDWEKTKQRYPSAFLFANIIEAIEAQEERKSPEFARKAAERTPSRR